MSNHMIAIQKFKDRDIQDYNFAFYFVWVCNMVLTLREERSLRVF